MKITIEYQNNKNRKVTKNIDELLRLIIDNGRFLEVISNMDIKIELKKFSKENIDKCEIIDDSIEELILSGDINEEEAQRFKELWISTRDEDLGKLLEEVVAQNGPYKLENQFVNYSRESKVFDTGRENNFDIIFYCGDYRKIGERKVEVTGKVEFHECKKNVCNVIPDNPNLLNIHMKNKLTFIKKVHSLKEDGSFYIPTFKYNTSGSELYLKDNGYEFIEILNIKKLIKRYCN